MIIYQHLAYLLSFVALLTILFSNTSLADISAPQISTPEERIDLGSIIEGNVAYGKFTLVNEGQAILDITDVVAKCGCTVIDFEPVSLHEGEEIVINFSIDTAGKMGDILKSITVVSNDPETPNYIIFAFIRVITPEHEVIDKTKLFEGECANCHSLPAIGLVDEPLFEAVCFMCHGHHGLGGLAKPINDLDYLSNFDENYFREIISGGKEDSMMPAFSSENGGPLTDEQIDSLVNLMIWWREGFMFRNNPAAQGAALR